eukprot:jgi/Chlat1/6929/Chrsp52S06609
MNLLRGLADSPGSGGAQRDAQKRRLQAALQEAVSAAGDAVNWDAAFRLVDLLDCLAVFKPYVKTPAHHIAVKALLVLDVCVKNAGPDFHLHLASRPWQKRLSKLATSSPYPTLSSSSSSHSAELRRTCENLAAKGITVPPPSDEMDYAAYAVAPRHAGLPSMPQQSTTPRSNGYADSFGSGSASRNSSQPGTPQRVIHIIFRPEQLQQENSVSSLFVQGLSVVLWFMLQIKVEHIRMDVTRLRDAMRAAQTSSANGFGLEEAKALRQRCQMWADSMQGLLMQDNLPESTLMELLAANDELNDVLEQYQREMTLQDIQQRTGPANEQAESSRSRQELADLQSELEATKLAQAQQAEAHAAHLAAALASHQTEMDQVKSLAVLRMKELMQEEEKLAKMVEQESSLREEVRELRTKRDQLELRAIEMERELAAAKSEAQALREQLAFGQTLRDKYADAERRLSTLTLELKRESILRKKLYNQIREMKGNIRVLARVRPLLRGEGPDDCALSATDEYTLEILQEEKRATETAIITKRYEYDHVFTGDVSQEEVYQETHDLIQSVFDGYNICIFCYGQTGSGKTYTILGQEDQPGIVPRAMQDIFNFARPGSSTVSVQCSMLELYQDNFMDLLSAADSEYNPKLEVKKDAAGVVRVEGAVYASTATMEDLRAAYDRGIARRRTASTKMNVQSSRSHLMFTILVEYSNLISGTTSRGKLTFVDLAGSERVAKSGALESEARLNEARAINKSLSALGDVVAALTSNASFVPYRNHKLTQLMSDSLGGNAKTLMIVNVSPLRSDGGETRNSLDYAGRVKLVANNPDSNRSLETKEVNRLKTILAQQAEQIRQLQEKQQ